MRAGAIRLATVIFVVVLANAGLMVPANATTPPVPSPGYSTLAGEVGGVTTIDGLGSSYSAPISPDSGIITLTGPLTILDMQSFRLEAMETLTFDFRGMDDIVIIRVAVGSADILGSLRTLYAGSPFAGNVWISAPDGVAFGPASLTEVHGLLATTSGMTTVDFFDGDGNFTFGGAPSGSSLSVSPGAQINGSSGTYGERGEIVFAAPNVVHGGDVSAPYTDVIYSSASDYTLSWDQFDSVIITPGAGAGTIELAGETTVGNIVLAQAPGPGTNRVYIHGTLSAQGPGASGNGYVIVTGSRDVAVAAGGQITGATGVVINAGGDVMLAGAMDDSPAASVNSTYGTVAVSVGATFVNNAGASAITAYDHWVIYAPSADGNTYGGLDSGTTALWGSSMTSTPPEMLTGNRYVFSSSPKLTFTSLDLEKRQGDDATGALTYSVTGFHPGVEGAFVGDSATTAFTGTPALTSAGVAADATVGTYPITIAQGSLEAISGYSFDFVSSGVLIVDNTPPAITYVLNPATPTGNTGWYTGDVAIDWTVTNSETTVAIDSGCDDQVINTNTATTGLTLDCFAHSVGGSASESLAIYRDATVPTISATLSPDTPTSGWYNIASGAPTVSFACDDVTSGLAIDACPSPHTFIEGADQAHSGTVTDIAGNSNSAGVTDVDVDLTRPTDITFVGGIADGGSYPSTGVPALPTCTANGGTSGFAGCVVSGYETTLGTHTLLATATDNAGNEATATITYRVTPPWTIVGFLAPVDMGDGVTNAVKGGTTVPLKFEVFDGNMELTNTSIVKAFTQKVECGATGTEDVIEQYATGGTGLRYDTTSGQFIFNWRTPKSPGSCYIVMMETTDGSQISAHFTLK